MGRPIRIIELAEYLIQEAGFKPYEDIDIKVTGVRKGEKMVEELAVVEGLLKETEWEKILLDEPDRVDTTHLKRELEALRSTLDFSDRHELMMGLRRLVPSFKPS